jgi:hypothetical protein
MVRRLYAIAAVLLLSGLLPLAANSGFCAAKPCCRIHSHASTASLANPACCNPTNCDTAIHYVDATSAKSTTVQPQVVVAAIRAQEVLIAAQSDATIRVDSGPPPLTRQRLATLSILLI